jgi:ABC-type transport system involved in multi-copper enzyme maturation permease subunit
VNLTIMAAALYAVLAYMAWMLGPGALLGLDAPAFDPALLTAVGLTFVELAIVTAIALFFSTFSTPMLSAALTFGLFIAGRLSADLRNFNQVVDSRAAGALATGLYWVLPNLAAFDVRSEVVHGQNVPAGYLALTIGYGLMYIAAMLIAATVIFSRRDFK